MIEIINWLVVHGALPHEVLRVAWEIVLVLIFAIAASLR